MIPLFTSNQVKKADEYAINELKIPSIVLMENAANNIFYSIIKNFGELDRFSPIGILAGKGNNGGDALALARHFINQGFNVKIITFCAEINYKGDAQTNYIITKKLIRNKKKSSISLFKSIKDISKFSDCSLIIDGLLGTGASGELKEPYKSVILKINKFNSLKVSIDIPTGLDVDRGSGAEIFRADLTVTLAGLKRGLFFQDGYAFTKMVEKGSIGIGDEYFSQLDVEDYLIEPEDALLGLPVKQNNLHKYSAGKVLTIAGSGNLPGAAILTANAVLQSGAGACLLAFPKSIKAIAQTKLHEAVVLPYEDSNSQFLQTNNLSEIKKRIDWADCIAIGPGLGREESTVDAVRDLIKNYPTKQMVIDADAIYALNSGEYKKYNLRKKVLTPHHHEFAKLIGIAVSELEIDLLKYGKEFVQETKSYLVLKGAPTIIFTPTGEAFINTSGNSGMAKFGMGDVLTGFIASFISQSNAIEQSVIAAVYLHSLSADLLLQTETEFGISAENVFDNFSKTIYFIRNSLESDI